MFVNVVNSKLTLNAGWEHVHRKWSDFLPNYKRSVEWFNVLSHIKPCVFYSAVCLRHNLKNDVNNSTNMTDEMMGDVNFKKYCAIFTTNSNL